MVRDLCLLKMVMLMPTILSVADAESLLDRGTLVWPRDGTAAGTWRASGTEGVDPHARAEMGDGTVTVTTLRPGEGFWSVQLLADIDQPVAKGDTLWLEAELRCDATASESGDGTATFYFQQATPEWDKSLSHTVTVPREGRRVQLPFRSRADYAAGQAQLGIGLGDAKQTITVTHVRLLNFGRAVRPSDLPRTRTSYAGREPDAAWREEAAKRIDRIRKGDLAITVVDEGGRPVPHATVAVRMKRHAFGFGSTVVMQKIGSDDPADDVYRRHVEELFNRVSAENDLKWPQWEADDQRWSRHRTLAGLRWVRQRYMTMHGHVLVWPSFKRLPDRLHAMKDDKPALRQAVLDHITDIMTATRGLTQEWDVVNEPFSNHDLMDVLGRDVMIDWYKLAHAMQPDTRLYLNDYGILASGNRNDTRHQQHFEDTLRFLIDGGAPLHGIGVQSHFGENVTQPTLLWTILDRFATFGVPIQVTEFDVNTDDEQLQADYTRDFMTAVFAHEAVEGFVMWGFWEGRHWIPKAAMYRKDWSIKPNGEVYKDLVFNRWWTTLDGRTDADGVFRGRGFLGEYEVTVSEGGRATTQALQLTRAGGGVTVTLR